ncbi:hypothetical protein KC318_g652 [Hortaea werneckii]|nr:hypothetical protein KC334_g744 [Hortaea werneckii]KAI7026242.1 hypothetical protein KC355_g708 [Hortaea werneckii]KAI7203217.1 hypothetical protein KC324_g1366 [Hortaea werneckii]KAI7594384.1 hypothetical protein KC316_g1159 [Hortaea werneckii]KAI7675876.1 hypothetical protein KC318_g652 [Hortaea werneckii]
MGCPGFISTKDHPPTDTSRQLNVDGSQFDICSSYPARTPPSKTTEATSSSHNGLFKPSTKPQLSFSSESTSALHLAAASGNLDCVKTLLKHGANVHATDNLGRTPLHACSEAANTAQHAAVLHLLIDEGANPTAKDGSCMTPLHIAAQNGFHIIVQALLLAGADVNAS